MNQTNVNNLIKQAEELEKQLLENKKNSLNFANKFPMKKSKITPLIASMEQPSTSQNYSVTITT